MTRARRTPESHAARLARLTRALAALGRPSGWRTAAWTWCESRSVRARISAEDAVLDLSLHPPPPGQGDAADLVRLVLRARGAACLERALVLQAWFAARGQLRDVVVAVAPSDRLDAHAWVDGVDPPLPVRGYQEIHRRPAKALSWVA